MTTQLATKQNGAQALEKVLLTGDLKDLSAEERVIYVKRVCETVGLNPLTRPLEYIVLNGKLTLYARKDATDQLRKIHGVSITDLKSEQVQDVYKVTAYATDKQGRTDLATGAVTIGNLKGDNLANALMKAETKAKRRVTLSICGLGLLDETEVETIPNPGPVVTEVITPKVPRDNPVAGYNVHTFEEGFVPAQPEQPQELLREEDDVLPSAASLRTRYDKAKAYAKTNKKEPMLQGIWREQVQEGKGWDDLSPAAQVRLVSDYEAALEL